jgi:hypothetical protein
VDRPGPDAGPLRDDVERHVRPFPGERLAGGGQDPLAVAAGIGAQWPGSADDGLLLKNGAIAPYIKRGKQPG